MALCFSTAKFPSSKLQTTPRLRNTFNTPKCTSEAAGSSATDRNSSLKIGSAIIVLDAPKTIKTAASVPCLRVNADLVKPGDVGRIVARKPKDVWAVRLAIGTYLLDGKHSNHWTLMNEEQALEFTVRERG